MTVTETDHVICGCCCQAGERRVLDFGGEFYRSLRDKASNMSNM